MTVNVYGEGVNVYTLEEAAVVLGVAVDHFEDVLEKVAYPKSQPVRYRLKTPLDLGERLKMKYIGYVKDQGYAFFPSVASLERWLVECPQDWAANATA